MEDLTEDTSVARSVVEALGPNTVFMYRYRDASNFKNSATVIFRGRPFGGDDTAINQMSLFSDDGVYFIPEQVGLRGLQGSWGARYSEDDHAWHEIVSLNATEQPPTDPRHVNEFVDEFCSQIWDIECSSIADELRVFDEAADDWGATAINA
jgi:hypothetical protein